MNISPRIPCLVAGLSLFLATTRAQGSGAERFIAAAANSVDQLEADMDQITSSAEEAAKLFVEKDYPIAVAGDPPFISEALGRSGGLVSMKALPPAATANDPAWKGIVLYAIDDRRFDQDLPRITELRKQGCHVIAFARETEIDQANGAHAEFDSVIENRAAHDGGLFAGEHGRHSVVPTDGVADIAAMWTWTAEFVAACTRLGKMPTMYLGYVNPGGRERADKIGGAKFHEAPPPKVGPGVLGTQYLQTLRQNLDALRQNEFEDIRTAAKLASAAQAAGGKLYTVTLGHAMADLLTVEPAPGYFTELEPAEQLAHQLTSKDFALVVAYSFFPDDAPWNTLLTHLRDSGATVVWSVSPYQPAEVAKIPKKDLLIDQQWAEGDADVVVPGYDIKVIPTSGVLAETVYWMVNAEMLEPAPSE